MVDTGAISALLASFWAFMEPYVNMVYPNIASALPALAVMIPGIVVYGILIYNFYHFLAKRDVFEFNVQKYRVERISLKSDFFISLVDTLLGAIKYGLLFPLVVFLWFGGFSLMLFLLAKNLAISQMLLISVVFVSSIRLTAYYTEDLSTDLAKLIPLVLLGIAIVDPSFFSFGLFVERVFGIAALLPQVLSYLVFIVMFEWLLRILLFVRRGIFRHSHLANSQ